MIEWMERVPKDVLAACVSAVITGTRDPEVLAIARELEDSVRGLGKRGAIELMMRFAWWEREVVGEAIV